MTKRETIDRIMTRNPSAQPDFLVQFCESELADYLRQLEAVGHRGRPGGSIRRSGWRTSGWPDRGGLC